MSLYDLTDVHSSKTPWADRKVAGRRRRARQDQVLRSERSARSRLAPDQYPLSRQIQSACDTAKFTPARLTGKEAPKHPDTEQTFDELRTRIHAVLEYIDSYKPADFAGAEAAQVKLPWLDGKYILGADYVSQQQLPNFDFHATLAYEILRHNGVPLGKMDFLGHISVH